MLILGVSIRTYGDPYRLTQSWCWADLASAPHLCAAQTLANGLRKLYGRGLAPVITAADEVLRRVYPSWHRNTETEIAQYVCLSEILSKVLEKSDRRVLQSWRANQRSVLASIRFLAELEIDVDDLDWQEASPAQCVLIEAVRAIRERQDKVFEFPQYTPEQMKAQYRSALLAVLEEERNGLNASMADGSSGPWRIDEINHVEQAISAISRQIPDKAVIHGVHQFSPLLLSFVRMLDAAGIEVVLLFHYNPKYPRVFDTWKRVYQWFDTNLSLDTEGRASQGAHNPLGHALAMLIEGKPFDFVKPSVEFIEFDNATAFANYIVPIWQRAKADAQHSASGRDPATASSELFYAAQNDVDDLLKLVFPSDSQDRHFLAYPVGQFFLGLYCMWDPERQCLKLEERWLKECLSAGLVRGPDPNVNVPSTYERTAIFFRGADYYPDFLDRISQLRRNLASIGSDQGPNPLNDYAFYRISRDELDALESSIKLLEEFAERVFADQGTGNGRINFRRHYARMLTLIEERAIESAIHQEEKELLDGIIERLQNIGDLSVEGSFDDLKQSVHYYLASRRRSDDPGWIVRNFEQIEGDMLSAKGSRREVTYHFGALSDSDMSRSADDRLPWPLTRKLLDDSEASLKFDFRYHVTMASLDEYNNFMRYAFFYGLLYCEKRIRLSYVREHGDEILQPYFLLRMLGIEPVQSHCRSDSGFSVTAKPESSARAPVIPKVDTIDTLTFMTCPYRYLLDRILGSAAPYEDEYLYKEYYRVLLTDGLLRRAESKPKELVQDRLDQWIRDNKSALRPYFPFWRDLVDLADASERARQYVLDQLKGSWGTPIRYSGYHAMIRRHFIMGKLDDGGGGNVVSFFWRCQDANAVGCREQMRNAQNEIAKYLSGSTGRRVTPGEWCMYCKQRAVCLEPYGRSKAGE